MKNQVAFYHPNQDQSSMHLKLEDQALEVHRFKHKEKLIEYVKRHKIDLILLYEVQQEEQVILIDDTHKISYIPILIVSKLTHIKLMTEALYNGADDYVSSSESESLIVAKIHAIIRRSRHIRKLKFGVIRFQHLEFNLHNYEVRSNGVLLPITNKEFELLHLFLSNPKHTLKKEDLFRELWSSSDYYSENVINVHMRHIRKKIELNPEKPQVIETVWGFGYRLGKGIVEHLD